MTKEFYD